MSSPSNQQPKSLKPPTKTNRPLNWKYAVVACIASAYALSLLLSNKQLQEQVILTSENPVPVFATSQASDSKVANAPPPITAFDDRTRCADLVVALDRSDAPFAQAAFRYVNGIMNELDAGYVKRHQRSVMAPLSPDGLEKTVISGFEQCRHQPKLTVKKAAVQTYEGIRQIGAAFGLQR